MFWGILAGVIEVALDEREEYAPTWYIAYTERRSGRHGKIGWAPFQAQCPKLISIPL